jgi:spore coat polysaccharide biosynthesis predicted glycosyltransferase SpsG
MHLTSKVLELFKDTYPELKKYVVIGSEFENKNEILELSQDNNTFIFDKPSAQEMKNIILDSDCVVSAAGQTLYEVACLGVPCIAVCVSDNQNTNIQGWKKSGRMECIDLNSNYLKKLQSSFEYLKGINVRLKYVRDGKNYIDGQGARRVATYIKDKAVVNKDVRMAS